MVSSRADKPRSLDPLIDAVLADRYRVERLIGRGGMGLVYMAHDEHDGRKVVVKLLAPHFHDDPTAVSRFEREGRRLKQLAHPNVVTMLECGHHGDQGFIAMEYLDGEPLRRYLQRRGALSLAEFTPIAAQILAAVGFAHDRNIMLRDIKPANIMLCERDGRANFVKLLDFGLAKLVDGDQDEVTKSHVIGTAGYLAPEQIKGEPTDVRVDVYALGVLFYMMLAGESPIVGENDGALLYNHVHGVPKPLATVLRPGHNVPEPLVALVHQCLEKDPARRPADANEIVEAMFECVPPKLFTLPQADEASRRALQDYRDARDRRIEDDVQSSAEWTKPVVRAALEAAAAAPVKPPVRRTSQSVPGVPQPIHDRGSARGSSPRRVSTPEIPPPQPGGRGSAPIPVATAARPASVPIPLPGPPPRLPRPRPAALRRPTPPATTGVDEIDVPVPVVEPVRSISVEQPAAAANEPVGAPTSVPETALELGDIDAIEDARPAVQLAAPLVDSAPIGLGRPAAMPINRRWLVAAGVVALLVGGTAAWLVFRPSPGPSAADTAASSTTVTPSPTTASSPGTSPTPSPITPPGRPIPNDAGNDKGALEVRAIQGARIEVDGVDVGPAPLSTALPVGTHRIRVVAPGYVPWEDTVDVVEGDNPFIEARLRQDRRRGKGTGKTSASDPSDAPLLADPEDDATDRPPELLPDKPPPPKASELPSTPRRPPPPPDVRRDDNPFLPTSKPSNPDPLSDG